MASPPGKGVRMETTESISETPLLNPQVDRQYYLTKALEGVEHTPYRGISSFTATIDGRTKETLSDTASQYIAFSPVTQKQLAEIEQFRDAQYKGLRFTYLSHKQTLIAKIMPGAAHEIATGEFTYSILAKASEMGFRRGLVHIGSTTFTTPSGGKEGDTTFKPRQFRPYDDAWPTLVIETGVSQSLPSLITSSHWWLEESKGEVKTVILVSLSKSTRRIQIQKWEAMREPNLRVTIENPDAFIITPTKTHQIDITDAGVNGAPLRVEFDKLMLREPQDRESDLVFDTHELAQYAADIWAGIR